MSNLYARIENGEAVYLGTLPRNWKNYTNFNEPGGLKKAALLKELGWVPLEEVETSHDSETHYVASQDIDIQADKVVLTELIKEFTRYQLEQRTFGLWHSKMIDSDEDGMDRKEEDHITRYHGGVPSDASKGPNKKTDKELYDAKVALRATKPADPVPPKPGEPDYEEPTP